MRRGRIFVAGPFGTIWPVRVQVLSLGPRRAHVRLLKRAKLPRKGTTGLWVARGETAYVPATAVLVNRAGPRLPRFIFR